MVDLRRRRANRHCRVHLLRNISRGRFRVIQLRRGLADGFLPAEGKGFEPIIRLLRDLYFLRRSARLASDLENDRAANHWQRFADQRESLNDVLPGDPVLGHGIHGDHCIAGRS